ncbi:MAG TPA: ABC transporter ATP-binding protein [Oligoflexia bacterium]|nr:ABC transporter ATP-binding protein [Oligoflexia bacterium]HMP47333.1 ABC transporter ATP-binding protein [Oligoflexia bacterium]
MNHSSKIINQKNIPSEGLRVIFDHFYRGRKKVLGKIIFELLPGQIIGVVGVNGAGKTTLLDGMLESRGKNSQISLIYEGVNISSYGESKKAKIISHLGSSDLSKPRVSVDTFIRFALEKYRAVDCSLGEVEVAVEYWGLSAYRRSLVSELSEGEFQRVLLATAFLQEAKFYILDEPERHLDPVGTLMLEIIFSKKAALGKGVLFATHDINLALSVSTHLLGIDKNGEVVFYYPAARICEERLLDLLYGVSFDYINRTSGKFIVCRSESSISIPSGIRSGEQVE